MCDKEKFELDRDEDPMSFSTSIPLDWRYEGGAANNLANTSGGLVGSSYVPNFWDHPINSQNMGLCDINGSSSSNSIGNIRKDGLPFSRAVHDNRTLEIMGWNNPSISSVLKGDGFLPQSLSQIPTDSGFIERAARFSCFSGGNFGDMVNSFGVPQSMGLYDRRNGLGGQSQENPLNVGEAAAKDVSVSPTISVQNLATNKGSSPIRNDRRSESLVTSQDEEAKQALGTSVNNGSDRAESSGNDGACGQDDAPMLEDASGEPLNKGINSKKRKRNVQDGDNEKAGRATEIPNETALMEDSDSRQNGGQQPNSTIKNSGKNVKQSSQASDPPKEEYIHVRARRGQATNSHSLAERVRREKISERMKFLQDLVPGCSKVTGKAVMLDEIINYVQSLQRQVEFLSMKLATVNSRLDFNLEGLIAKDILQQRPGPSSLLGFPPEMPMAFPSLHPSQPGFLQSSLHGITNSSEIIRRTIHSQLAPLTGGFKDSSHQLPDMWEDELHNIVQLNFPTTTAPLSSAEGNAAQPEGQMKVEL